MLSILFAVITLHCLSAFADEGTVHHFEWVAQDWVVDFMRPTTNLRSPAARLTPFNIPRENMKAAQLINGMYPGPAVEVFENDTVEINVHNNLLDSGITIHWHGIHPYETPWEDGAAGVTQAPIMPGFNYTYRFKAWPHGTHYWHAHMDAMQAAKGVKGPFIVKRKDEDEPFRKLYDEDKIVVISDEWRNPEVCLKLEGAMPGNDVCSDFDYGSFNGQYGNGSAQYPFPLIDVEQGKCYRLRFIGMMSNAENFIISVAGHQMTLLALDGYDVEPIKVSSINLHIAERMDVAICADQDPGYYPINATYDYACTLTAGNFIPPGFHPVRDCSMFAFLHYKQIVELYPVPSSPIGTGGGAYPKAVTGPAFDLTTPSSWSLTRPLVYDPEPEEPDIRYVIDLGLQGPTYSKATDQPLHNGRWYMDLQGRRQTWHAPSSPLLHTKGQCGAENTPVLHIPENATTVEIVLNNLSPTAHIVHMHGMPFKVINIANFEWCSINKTACFVMPEAVNPCPLADRRIGDPTHPLIMFGMYWGCAYNQQTDKVTQNLETPLVKDSFQIWQRSWAVIRFKATLPGMWLFHCHMEHHIPLGMIMALNVKPSEQPPIPDKVLREGSCPVWSDKEPSEETLKRDSYVSGLETENEYLKEQLKKMQTK